MKISALNFKNISPVSEKNSQSIDYARKSFFCNKGVKECKDLGLRTRLQTLIKKAGLTNSQFYKKVGISRQYYYFISWGLWKCPLGLKLRIAKILDCDSSLIFQKNSPDWFFMESEKPDSSFSKNKSEVENAKNRKL